MPSYEGGIEAARRRYNQKHPQRKETSHICYEWFDEDMMPHSIILHSADSFERLYPWVKRYFKTLVNYDETKKNPWRRADGVGLELPYKAKV